MDGYSYSTWSPCAGGPSPPVTQSIRTPSPCFGPCQIRFPSPGPSSGHEPVQIDPPRREILSTEARQPHPILDLLCPPVNVQVLQDGRLQTAYVQDILPAAVILPAAMAAAHLLNSPGSSTSPNSDGSTSQSSQAYTASLAEEDSWAAAAERFLRWVDHPSTADSFTGSRSGLR